MEPFEACHQQPKHFVRRATDLCIYLLSIDPLLSTAILPNMLKLISTQTWHINDIYESSFYLST